MNDKYIKTRQVILDLIGILEQTPRSLEPVKLHIDLACDKIEMIWSDKEDMRDSISKKLEGKLDYAAAETVAEAIESL